MIVSIRLSLAHASTLYYFFSYIYKQNWSRTKKANQKWSVSVLGWRKRKRRKDGGGIAADQAQCHPENHYPGSAADAVGRHPGSDALNHGLVTNGAVLILEMFIGNIQRDGSCWKNYSIGIYSTKEWGAEVSRKIRPSTILWEPFKDSAPPRTFVGNWSLIANSEVRINRAIGILTMKTRWCVEVCCYLQFIALFAIRTLIANSWTRWHL